MDIKKLEKRIKGLKSVLNKQKEEASDAVTLRKTKKRLKRAQRKENTLIKRTKFIESKAKKKEQAASK